ncbi:MAG TPA: polysaccharide biosynthesis/export family protein, partial [Bryobacterales bacterium]|nr:polysaccharide biosynthesis/export family protein [Bryobacterales bacterium]
SPRPAPAAERSVSPEREEGFAPNGAYRLGPGDVIDITVFEVEELSRPAAVSPDGTVALPLIGVVKLAGLTTREAAARLCQLYGKNLLRNPQISVSVKEYHSQPVSVLGAVMRPGIYQLRGPRRLSDLLALAEGLAPDAGDEIVVERAMGASPPATLHVPARGLLHEPGQGENNPWVEGGDTIRVAQAGLVYVVGEVGRPGGFPIKNQEPVTVLKALSLAEGLRREAAPQRARIIRQRDSARQETPVRLRDILEGRAPDVPLDPGDILFVPNSQARTVMGRAAEAAIQTATGVVIWRR